MPRQQLLGHIDMDTREWADGVLTSSARNVVREPQGRKSNITRHNWESNWGSFYTVACLILNTVCIEVNVLCVSATYPVRCMFVFLDVNSWIVCDGDIDPEWIESLNSVLDDNRLLTMPSGERIQFGPNVNFLFETHDLSCASPATISRMGMIFLRSVSLFSVYLYQVPLFSA